MKQNITVAEVKERIGELEQNIAKLLNEFSDVTGFTVDYVNKIDIQTVCGIPRYLIKVEVNL